MAPTGPDHREEGLVHLFILLMMAAALHCAGWDWEHVRTVYELLAAAVALAAASTKGR